MQKKTLLLVQDVETMWKSLYFMLKRLEKISVQNYVANKKLKPRIILTDDEWKLVNYLVSCSIILHSNAAV